jgi:hypothetical protein
LYTHLSTIWTKQRPKVIVQQKQYHQRSVMHRCERRSRTVKFPNNQQRELKTLTALRYSRGLASHRELKARNREK